VVLTPTTNGLVTVFNIPVVKVRVPETVPVPVPFNAFPEKVTPAAFELFIVTLVKQAVGIVLEFLKTPVPETVCATVEAVVTA
jgi:hypothetical protein